MIIPVVLWALHVYQNSLYLGYLHYYTFKEWAS